MDEFDYMTWEREIVLLCEKNSSLLFNTPKIPGCLRPSVSYDDHEALKKLILRGSAYVQHARDDLVPDRVRMGHILRLAEIEFKYEDRA